MLPDYFVIGAAKCGTTSICSLLGQHPDVFMSDPMEIHYFGREDPEKTRAWYEAHFSQVTDETAVGEGSTSYTHPDIIQACASEIASLLPGARLIYMVRNPIRRLESDWKMRMHEGWAAGDSINEAVREPGTTLLRHGMYWRNLNVYRERFADEQIHVVFLEDFGASPRSELQRCFTHLGVDPDVKVEDPHRARNRSGDFRRDRRIGKWLRNSGLIAQARRIVPSWLFSLGKAALTRPDRFTVRWDPEVKTKVVRCLEEDSRRFLAYCGKPEDFWSGD